MNSKEKGKRGEREFAGYLREYGLNAQRGQQFKGGDNSPDVICSSLPDTHFEVKFTEASRAPYDWLDQAKNDAGKKLPIVAHRRNGREWIAIMFMDDCIELLIKLGEEK